MVGDDDFVRWLTRQTDRRGWSNRELARRAGLAATTVSLVIRGRRRAGWDFCAGVARAFGVEPDEVFRRAGLLPSLPTDVAEAREAERIVRGLPNDLRTIALHLLRSLAELKALRIDDFAEGETPCTQLTAEDPTGG